MLVFVVVQQSNSVIYVFHIYNAYIFFFPFFSHIRIYYIILSRVPMWCTVEPCCLSILYAVVCIYVILKFLALSSPSKCPTVYTYKQSNHNFIFYVCEFVYKNVPLYLFFRFYMSDKYDICLSLSDLPHLV